jgi:transcriptional regulator with XRE-family HTH domain
MADSDWRSDEFARRLRTARAYHDITGPDLAKKVGVSRMAVWKYEHGQAYPCSSVLIKIGRELNVSLDWLMCGAPLQLKCENGNSLCQFNLLKCPLHDHAIATEGNTDG